MNKYVLIACEESQTECVEFRRKGAIAFSCDILPCSGGHPEWHIRGDAIKALYSKYVITCDGYIHHIPHWDLVIAHPPCTYLSKVGSPWLFKNGDVNMDRYHKGLEGKEFFMKFYKYGLEGNRIAIENPIPNHIWKLPMPNDVLQPYYFGEPFSKKLYLWTFKVPNLMPTSILCDYVSYHATVSCSKKRSKSFTGIAKAMADQWYDIL